MIHPPRHHSGFLLLEAMVGIAVFALFIGAVGLTMLYGQEGTIMAGDRTRATYLSEQAIEVARAVREQSFSSLAAGTHGWKLSGVGVWSLTGSQVISSGSYSTSLTISSIASDIVGLTARTTWKHGYNRSGSVIITSELADWRSTRSIGNWSSLTVEGSYVASGTPSFVDLSLFSGAYVFAAARTSPGLYVIDTSNTASPTRINSSFSLGTGAWDTVIRGDVLYVATDNTSQEIYAYRISSPATFSSAQLIGSYNVPGNARLRSLALQGDVLFAGATASSTAGEAEFYAFRVSSGGTITLLDSIDDNSGTVSMISVAGDTAYLASSHDTGELRAVDVSSGANLTLLGGYNLTDRTLDGLSIATSGTAAILGTQKGSIQEVVMFQIEDGVPSPPPGPWYHEGSGSIVGIATDPSRCYAFLAAQSGRKALQVMNMRNTATLQELATYTSSNGLGSAVFYDMRRDRTILATDGALFIFRPGTTTGTCP